MSLVWICFFGPSPHSSQLVGTSGYCKLMANDGNSFHTLLFVRFGGVVLIIIFNKH